MSYCSKGVGDVVPGGVGCLLSLTSSVFDREGGGGGVG